MPKTDRQDIAIEELILELGLVSTKQLAEIVAQSKKTGLSLGRTLVLAQAISEQNVERLLKLQAIYRGCKIPRQLVLDAYRYAVREAVTVEEALAKTGIQAQIVSFSRLGTLLVDAKLISKEQLDEAQKLAYETHFPLGKMLTMHGAITQNQLNLALELQQQMRTRTISKDEALAQLSQTKATVTASTMPADTSIALPPDAEPKSPRKINLVELLVVSGIIHEHDADKAFEASLKSKQRPVDILRELNLLPESLFQITVELHEAVSNGDLDVAAAAESLNYIAEHQ